MQTQGHFTCIASNFVIKLELWLQRFLPKGDTLIMLIDRAVHVILHVTRSVGLLNAVASLLSLNFLFPGSQALGQTGDCSGKRSGTIACVVPNLLTQVGTQAFGSAFVPPSLNTPTGSAVLISPLTASLPLPSPASGAIYNIDIKTGIIERSESYGPILSERAETIGRRKFSSGFTFQRFVFDRVDGFNVHNLSFGSNEVINGIPISVNYNFSMSLNRYTMFGTYGITNNVDVSVAIPFSNVNYGLALRFTPSQASLSTPSPTIASGSSSKSVTGLSDITVQIKGTVYKRERAALAMGLAVRTPTGDPYNALGAGAVGVRPFFAASYAYKLSPHINLGYEWNGKSVLTGNILTGQKANLPKQLIYAAGFDSSLLKRLTVSFDVIGRELFHGQRIDVESVSTPVGSIALNNFYNSSFAINDGSVGFKLNPFGNLLLTGNLLFRLNQGGLRSKVAPLFGVSYTFGKS